MSIWSYVFGTIEVEPKGRTQAEKEYILKTVLDHLPPVTGSEKNMSVQINQCIGYESHCYQDEFGTYTKYLSHRVDYDMWSKHGKIKIQDSYTITVRGLLRDRELSQTLKEFTKWLCRLAKRVLVNDILVRIDCCGKNVLFDYRGDNPYSDMYEWTCDGEPNWCDYLMWERGINSELPMKLEYKYYNNAENDAEIQRRINCHSD